MTDEGPLPVDPAPLPTAGHDDSVAPQLDADHVILAEVVAASVPSTEPIEFATVVAPTALPTAPLPGPNLLSAVGWTIAFFLGQALITIACLVPVGAVLAILGTSQQEMVNTITRWSVPIGTFGSVVTAVALAALKFGRAAPRCLGLRWPAAAQLFAIVLFVTPLWVAGSGLGELVHYWFPLELDPQSAAIQQLALTGWIGILIGGSLFPAFGEEIFFRGLLGRGLVARYGAVAGTLLTSLIFGLFHLTPAQIAGTFVIGLGLQLVYLTCKSLLAAMVLHFLINFQGLGSILVRAQMQTNSLAETAEFETFGGATVGLSVMAVGLLGLLLFRLRTTWVYDADNVWPANYITGETPPVAAIPVHDSLRAHGKLCVIACLVWLWFMTAFVQSGVFG